MEFRDISFARMQAAYFILWGYSVLEIRWRLRINDAIIRNAVLICVWVIKNGMSC